MTDHVSVKYIDHDLPAASLDSDEWGTSEEVVVAQYWSGRAAPAARHFGVRLLWSDTSLYVRFEAPQGEPLVVSDKPDLTQKTLGLWDRDVCEIFIAPDRADVNRYFEFEIAPTGEWVDLGISLATEKRETDLDYASGMQSAVEISDDKIVMAIKIGWAAFSRIPMAGDVWLGNLFRCVGKDPTRGYLAWQPTKTDKPNFHVPNTFGEFHFTK